MIALVWLTHALNVALLGRVMRTCGMRWASVVLAQVVFGLTAAKYETLCWSVQWSAVLSVTFMLLALDAFFSDEPTWRQVGWVASSALSFSRGVLTGPVLALGVVLQGVSGPGRQGAGRLRRAAWLVAPSVAVACLILVLSSGNHHHMGGHWADAAVYGLWYLCANPTHALLAVEPYGWHTVAVLGILKLGLIGWGLMRSSGRVRTLFVMLVAFEVGNAVLLGIGRFHTGLPTTIASRYQYASLLGSMPILGFAFSTLLGAVPVPNAVRGLVAAVILGALGLNLVRDWRPQIEPFTDWRGTQSRRILLEDPDPPRDAVPGIPGLPMDRAKVLIETYRLH